MNGQQDELQELRAKVVEAKKQLQGLRIRFASISAMFFFLICSSQTPADLFGIMRVPLMVVALLVLLESCFWQVKFAIEQYAQPRNSPKTETKA